MTLAELVAIADKGYPDGVILRAFNAEQGLSEEKVADIGDTLAVYIAKDLTETFEPDATDMRQLEIAISTLTTAKNEVSGAMSALSNRLQKLEIGE
jgi:hypothetical protein